MYASLNIISSRILNIISKEPSFIGLKSHVAPNGTSRYLSSADRQSALDPKNVDAPAYLYPVWLHFPIDTSLKNGTGGLKYTPTNISDSSIIKFINATLPFSNDHMFINNNDDDESPAAATHTAERSQHIFLGLTSIFLSLITTRATRHGDVSRDSREHACRDSGYIDDDGTDSWSTMSE